MWFKAKKCKLCCNIELMQTTVHSLPSCIFEQKEVHKVQGTGVYLSSNSYYMPCIVAKLKEQRKEFLFFAFHNISAWYCLAYVPAFCSFWWWLYLIIMGRDSHQTLPFSGVIVAKFTTAILFCQQKALPIAHNNQVFL